MGAGDPGIAVSPSTAPRVIQLWPQTSPPLSVTQAEEASGAQDLGPQDLGPVCMGVAPSSDGHYFWASVSPPVQEVNSPQGTGRSLWGLNLTRCARAGRQQTLFRSLSWSALPRTHLLGSKRSWNSPSPEPRAVLGTGKPLSPSAARPVPSQPCWAPTRPAPPRVAGGPWEPPATALAATSQPRRRGSQRHRQSFFTENPHPQPGLPTGTWAGPGAATAPASVLFITSSPKGPQAATASRVCAHSVPSPL